MKLGELLEEKALEGHKSFSSEKSWNDRVEEGRSVVIDLDGIGGFEKATVLHENTMFLLEPVNGGHSITVTNVSADNHPIFRGLGHLGALDAWLISKALINGLTRINKEGR